MSDEFVFLPLGGSGEIGMNMNLFALGPAGAREWIMIDCGVTFAGDELPGIDLVTPDHGYLLDELDAGASLKALVLTHGHEDHIGAVAHLWPDLDCEIIATPFTAELLRRKFSEVGIEDAPIRVLQMGTRFKVGRFDLEYITLTHSIPEPNAVAIRTEFGTVLHTGDWKIDPKPVLGEETDHTTLTELGDDGVIAMVCDSTNVFSAGRSGSESDVAETLSQIIQEQTGRVAVTTFASNVSRLVSVCRAAKDADRSVCLLGRSMIRMIDVARAVNLLPNGISFVEPKEAGFLPHDKILYLCTGSQGEPRAALARIARDDHPDITLGEGDTIIFSSKVIPGNERVIYDMMNDLTELGVQIVSSEDAYVHVSGHPCRDELKDMYEMVRPGTSIPVHGEARHIREHADLAKSLGIKHALTPRNGDMIRLAPGLPEVIDEVPSGRLYLDGRILLPQGEGVMRARKRLGEEGVIVVSIAFSEKGRLLGAPHVTIRGLPFEDNDGEELHPLVEEAVDKVLNALPRPKLAVDKEVEHAVRRAIRSELFPRWGKRGDIALAIIRG